MLHVKRQDLPPFIVPPEVRERLDAFTALLRRWNSRINLVANDDIAQIEQRHIADSLQLLPLLPGQGPWGDLGTGAGFPGLVIALATGREMHLVESDRRKAAFLQDAAARLGLPAVKVHPLRMEVVALPPLAALTARALAPLDLLVPQAARLLAPDGIAIFPKGRSAEAELTAAARAWTMQVERYQSRTDSTATIFRVKDLRRVGD